MKQTFKYIFILLIVPVFNAQCQVNFREGRIITSQNDTIHGLIKDGQTPRNTKVCLFKEDKHSKVVRYYPDDIRSYKIAGGSYYATQMLFFEGRMNPVFTDVLLEGKMNLYYFRKDKNTSYYLEVEGDGLVGLINRDKEIALTSNWRHSVYTDYEAVKIPIYKDTLLSLFKDSERALTQIHKVKYNHPSLIGITKAYLDETCEGDDCITYQKDLKRTRDRFGFYTGAHFSKIYFTESYGESGLETTIPFGVFYAIPLTFLHDRLAFQTELVYRRLKYNPLYYIPAGTEYDKMEWSVIGIPLLLNYKISANRISPTIGVGREIGFVTNSDVIVTTEVLFEGPVTSNQFIYRTQKGGWLFDLGMDYELSPKLSLFSNIRIQWHRNKVIANQYENNFTFKNAEGTMFDAYTAALHVGMRF